MMRPIGMLLSASMLVTLVIGAIACGIDLSELTTSIALPTNYEEVMEDYGESRAEISSRGREVVDLLIDNDAAAVYSQFDQKLKELLPLAELQTTLQEYCTNGLHIGACIDGRVWPISHYYRRYTAEHVWGEQTIAIRVGFDENFNVSELRLSPQHSLPPDPAKDYESNTERRLPFDGLWWVYWGGPTELQNYHIMNPAQRYACDLLIWKDGGTHQGNGLTNDDYWAFGQHVLAPADGTVVEVMDGIKDNTPRVPNLESHSAGNHVVIATGEKEYVFIAHFQQGSIRVQEGEKIQAGSMLGLTGNSGRSFEPHIHIHLQTEPDYSSRDAIGLPLTFSDYIADGQPVSKGVLVQGQFVRSEP